MQKGKESEHVRVFIKTEYIKLASLLKFAGFLPSGGVAKLCIENGDVLLDGEPCLSRGKKIVPGQVVSFSGKTVLVCAHEN